MAIAAPHLDNKWQQGLQRSESRGSPSCNVYAISGAAGFAPQRRSARAGGPALNAGARTQCDTLWSLAAVPTEGHHKETRSLYGCPPLKARTREPLSNTRSCLLRSGEGCAGGCCAACYRNRAQDTVLGQRGGSFAHSRKHARLRLGRACQLAASACHTGRRTCCGGRQVPHVCLPQTLARTQARIRRLTCQGMRAHTAHTCAGRFTRSFRLWQCSTDT